MIKSYKTHSFLNGLRFSCSTAIKTNRTKILLTFLISLIAIAIGIWMAVKNNAAYQLGRLQEISLENFYLGISATSRAFLSRSVSLVVNVFVLTIVSFSPFLYPLALALFAYRGYLFGLNFALIFIFYGVGSMFSAIVIILPCQMLTLFALVMFYIVLQKINSNCHKFGGTDCNRFVLVVVAFLILLLINFVETLLLCVLSGRIIMVI